jgi:hypothetical protein
VTAALTANYNFDGMSTGSESLRQLAARWPAREAQVRPRAHISGATSHTLPRNLEAPTYMTDNLATQLAARQSCLARRSARTVGDRQDGRGAVSSIDTLVPALEQTCYT